jgi:hypothetical protein
LGNDEEDKKNIKNKILHNVWIQLRDERVHMLADVIHLKKNYLIIGLIA